MPESGIWQTVTSMNPVRENVYWFLCLMAGVLLLVACTSDTDSSGETGQTSEEQASVFGRIGKTYVHECSDESRFTARIEGEKAWLFLPSGTISLPHVPAASGARYSDGVTTFWSRGEEASLERQGHPRVQCKNNRPEAIWEGAKLRGADFRGRGNEPGWYVEISNHYGIVFVTNYGSDRYHFETFTMGSDETSRKTRFEASHDAGEMLITLEGRRCSDSMSGEQFETRVTVIFEGKKLNGCGRALH